MTRFVVGSFLLALVELMDFATYTATHRVDAGVVVVRPHRGGRFCRAPPHVATSLGSHR
jgi:predicted aldo/keto reductase-like oxidoreductase